MEGSGCVFLIESNLTTSLQNRTCVQSFGEKSGLGFLCCNEQENGTKQKGTAMNRSFISVIIIIK